MPPRPRRPTIYELYLQRQAERQRAAMVQRPDVAAVAPSPEERSLLERFREPRPVVEAAPPRTTEEQQMAERPARELQREVDVRRQLGPVGRAALQAGHTGVSLATAPAALAGIDVPLISEGLRQDAAFAAEGGHEAVARATGGDQPLPPALAPLNLMGVHNREQAERFAGDIAATLPLFELGPVEAAAGAAERGVARALGPMAEAVARRRALGLAARGGAPQLATETALGAVRSGVQAGLPMGVQAGAEELGAGKTPTQALEAAVRAGGAGAVTFGALGAAGSAARLAGHGVRQAVTAAAPAARRAVETGRQTGRSLLESYRASRLANERGSFGPIELGGRRALGPGEEPAPQPGPWFSRLERAIDTAPFPRGTVQQWRVHLGKGLNQAELRDSGLEAAFIATAPQTVLSRDAVKALVLQPRFREVYRGGAEGAIPVKYERYRLPGGTNYREIVIRADPARPPDVEAAERALTVQMEQAGWDRSAIERSLRSITSADEMLRREHRRVIGQSLGPAGDALAATLEADALRRGEPFESGHWPESNPIAHLRLTDRPINGLQTTFAEEMQSDVHQAGRERGYRGTPAERATAVADHEAAVAAHAETQTATHDRLWNMLAVAEPVEEAGLERMDVMAGTTKIGTLSRGIAGPTGEHWYFYETGHGLGSRATNTADPVEATRRLKQLLLNNDGQMIGLAQAIQERAQPAELVPPALSRKGGETMAEWAEATRAELEFARQRAAEAAVRLKGLTTGPPRLPMSRTDDWAGLLIRRQVAEAVADGKDAIAWTPGKWAYRAGGADRMLAEGDRSRQGSEKFYDEIVPSAARDYLRRLEIKGLAPERVKVAEHLPQPEAAPPPPPPTGIARQVELANPGDFFREHVHQLSEGEHGRVREAIREIADDMEAGTEYAPDELDDQITNVMDNWRDSAYESAHERLAEEAREPPDEDWFRDGAYDYIQSEYGTPARDALDELYTELQGERANRARRARVQGPSEAAPVPIARLFQLADDLERQSQRPARRGRHNGSEAAEVIRTVAEVLDDEWWTIDWPELEKALEKEIDRRIDHQIEFEREQWEPDIDEAQVREDAHDAADNEIGPIEQEVRQTLAPLLEGDFDQGGNIPVLAGEAPPRPQRALPPPGPQEAWVLKITPELRAKVQGGQGLYLYSGPVAGQRPSEIVGGLAGAAVGAATGPSDQTLEQRGLRGLVGGLGGSLLGGKLSRAWAARRRPMGRAGAAAAPVEPPVMRDVAAIERRLPLGQRAAETPESPRGIEITGPPPPVRPAPATEIPGREPRISPTPGVRASAAAGQPLETRQLPKPLAAHTPDELQRLADDIRQARAEAEQKLAGGAIGDTKPFDYDLQVLGDELRRRGGAGPSPPGRPSPAGTPIEPTDFVNPAKFDVDATGEQRLADEVTRIVAQHGLAPKEKVTWEETRRIARQLGLQLETQGVPLGRRLTGPELLAIRNIVSANIEQLEQLYQRLASEEGMKASAEALQPVRRQIAKLEGQNSQLLQRFIPERSEAGRLLNSLKIIANRTLDPAVWLEKAKQLTGGVDLPEDVRIKIRELLATRDRAGLVQYLGAIREAPWYEKLLTLWKAGLVTNPPTHGVNIAGNTTMAILEQVKDAPAALADRLMALRTHERTVAGPTWQILRASLNGAEQGAKDAVQVLRGRDPRALERYDIQRETNYDNLFLNAYTKAVFRSLGAEDAFFRAMALKRSLTEQATVIARREGARGVQLRTRVQELVVRPPDEMALRAMHDAEVATFQDPTVAGHLAADVARRLGIAGEVILPFKRTPGAVATRVVEYGPLGLTLGTKRIAWDVLLKGQKDPAYQRAAAQLFGRGATGTTAVLLGYELARRGLATGAFPATGRDRDQWQMEGRQENSILIDGRWQNVGRIAPYGNLIAVGANVYGAAQQGDPNIFEALGQVAVSSARTIADQPFLQGVTMIRDAIADPERKASAYVQRLAGSAVPAGLSALARGTDVERTRERSQGLFDLSGITSEIQSRLPGVREQLPPAYDRLGQVLPTKEQRYLPWPGLSAVDQRQVEPLIAEMADAGYAIPALPRKAGEGALLYSRRQQLYGRAAKAAVEQTLASPAYAEARQLEQEARTLAQDLQAKDPRLAKIPVAELAQTWIALSHETNPRAKTRAQLLRDEVNKVIDVVGVRRLPVPARRAP